MNTFLFFTGILLQMALNHLLVVFLAVIFVVLAVFFFILPPGRAWLKVIAARVRVWPFPFISMWAARIDVLKLADLYRRARKSDVKVGLFALENLFHAEVEPTEIIEAMITAHNGQEPVSLVRLKQHALAGGNVGDVVEGLIAAKNADTYLAEEERMDLSFDVIAAIDLANIDVKQAIDDYVHPKVIETDEITAVAKDGVELTALVRITLKTDLIRIVAGADQDTIKSRINEGVVSVIGESDTHRRILQNTYEVGESIMAREELWEDGAYNVLSVDVVNVRVGRDVGSELKAKQAESEMTVHRSKEQEMKALAAEAEVTRIRAESEVQQAMADAFRDGNLTIHDYHNMQNKEADTLMRKSFSKSPHKESKNFDEEHEEEDDD